MSTGPVGGPDLFDSLRLGQIRGDQQRLKTATSLMESSFYQELFKVMRSTVPEGEFSGGQAENVFTAMLDQYVADEAASQSEGGIGNALYRHFVGAIGEPAGPDSSGASAEGSGKEVP